MKFEVRVEILIQSKIFFFSLLQSLQNATTVMPRLTGETAKNFSANKDFFAVFGLG